MPVSLNVAEYEKFIGIVPDSMLPLARKETALSFGVVWKNIWNILILSEKAIKIFLPFPTTHLWQLIEYRIDENSDVFYWGNLKKI